MSTDAIVMLREDHRQVRGLFREFRKRATTPARQAEIARAVIDLLTVHMFVENEVLYPQIRSLLPDLNSVILESYEEHHVADGLVVELAALDPGDERFEPKMTVLAETVGQHIDEEEAELFPILREHLGRKEMQDLGQRLAQARERAPRSQGNGGPRRRRLTSASPEVAYPRRGVDVLPGRETWTDGAAGERPAGRSRMAGRTDG